MNNASREFSIASRADLRGGAHLILSVSNRSWLERWSTGSDAIVNVWVEGVQGVWTGEGGSACLRAIMVSAALQGLAANMTFADGGNLVCVTTMFEADMRARGHEPNLGHMTALAKLSLGDEVFESTSDAHTHAMVAALESFLSDPFSPVHGVRRCPSGRYKKSCPAELGINNRLERAVANSADFLREAHEDLRFAVILASDTDQPRRAQSLSRAASTAKGLAGELLGAWVAARKAEPAKIALLKLAHDIDVMRDGLGGGWRVTDGALRVLASELREAVGSIPERKSAPKATKLVGSTLDASGIRLDFVDGTSARPPRGGETTTVIRGTTSLQMPAATPPEVVDVLFSIARPLGLDTDTVWPIESLAREVRELTSDAGHNDEAARGMVAIDDVCQAIGIDAMIHEALDGEGVSRPATREEIITKLKGIREAMLVSLQASVAIAGQLEVVEGGLLRRFAEHIFKIDPAWLEALVKESS